MKLLLAILISAAIHFAAVLLMPAFVVVQTNQNVNLRHSEFQLHLSSAPFIFVLPPLPNLLIQSALSVSEVNKRALNSHNKTQNYFYKPDKATQTKNRVARQYLSTSEIDIKALPISNLDISMFRETFISGIPIKLRLYINASGHIDKIERLSMNEPDEVFAIRLEELLAQLTFLPAKKDGIVVNSYQDVELGFN